MATFRQLPSGNWQAIVSFTVNGVTKQVPFTDPSKTVVENWASDQEYAKRHGAWRDPRRGRITLGAWHDLWVKQRIVEQGTAKTEASAWRRWVEPRWSGVTLEELERSREEIKEWVKNLVDDPDVGTWTVLGAAKLLRKMLADAVDTGRISSNPASKLGLPSGPKKPPFFWSHAEAGAIVNAIASPYATMVDFGMHVGPRIGELAGLKIDCIEPKIGLVHIVRVAVDGHLRDYPKTAKSYRSVPIPPHLLEPFDRLIYGKDRDDMAFTAPRGGILNDNVFRTFRFDPAVESARTCSCVVLGEDGRQVPCSVPGHGVRRGTIHDMRHTAASWLVMAGVDIYRVQDLLGHEKITTTQRYAHLDPTKHNALLAVWGSGGLTSGGGAPAVQHVAR